MPLAWHPGRPIGLTGSIALAHSVWYRGSFDGGGLANLPEDAKGSGACLLIGGCSSFCLGCCDRSLLFDILHAQNSIRQKPLERPSIQPIQAEVRLSDHCCKNPPKAPHAHR